MPDTIDTAATTDTADVTYMVDAIRKIRALCDPMDAKFDKIRTICDNVIHKTECRQREGGQRW